MRILITISLVFLGCFKGLSQEQPKEQVGQLLDSAKILINKGELNQALFVTKQALEIDNTAGKKDSLTIKVYDSHTLNYIELQRFDSAKIWLDRSLSLLKELGVENDLIAVNVYSTSGYFYAVEGDHDLSLMYKQTAHSICARILGNQHAKTGDMIRNIGRHHLVQGNYKEALHFYAFAHKTYLNSENPNQSKLARTFLGMGVCYRYLGDLSESIDLSKKGLIIWEVDSTAKYLDIVKAYTSLATSYSYNTQYDNAEKLFLKAIRRIEEKEGVNNFRMIRSYLGLADVYILSKNYNKAIRYANQAKTLVERLYGDSKKHLFFWSHGLLASAYRGKGDCNKAIDNYNLALKYGTIRPIARARMYTGVGSAYDACNNMELALNYFMKAVEILFSTQGRTASDLKNTYASIARLYSKNDDYEMSRSFYTKQLEVSETLLNPEHPDLLIPNLGLMDCASHLEDEDGFRKNEKKVIDLLKYDVNNPQNVEEVTDLFHLSTYLRQKADHLERSAGSKLYYFDSIEEIYQTALLIEDRIQNSFLERETKNDHFKLSFSLFEASVRNFIDQKKKDKNERAFVVVEKSKNRHLKENVQRLFAEKWSDIPSEMIERERELINEISYNKKELFEEEYESERSSDSLITEYKNELFVLEEEFESLIEGFEQNYPQYYQLKYDDATISVASIQKSLKVGQTMIEYFVGEEDLYLFLINKEELIVEKVPLDFPLSDWVEDMRINVYGYWTISEHDKEAYEERNKAYAELSYQLYEKLVGPLASHLSDKLIIIPDGVLNYLPFELLLKEKNETGDLRDHAYMIKDHQISYHYSATLWADKAGHSNEAKINGLFLAPEFKEDTLEYLSLSEQRSAMGPLEFSVDEVQKIQSLIGGDALIGSEATKKAFLERAKNYRIIHLSTHGKANEQFGDYSFIAFSEEVDSAGLDNRLYVQELYGIGLNADMVVLSACETGVGELQRGEGLISMARGFAYAGAQSTITSLWKVDDAITAELMTNFYSYLQEGKPKDEALRLAKLDHINKVPHADPFFWAGFVAVGNMEPIEFASSSTNYIYWILSVALLGLILFLRWKRRKT